VHQVEIINTDAMGELRDYFFRKQQIELMARDYKTAVNVIVLKVFHSRP
jgi:hypothetical protein